MSDFRTYTLSFTEYIATVQQFISMLPNLPMDLAESIFRALNRDYLNMSNDDATAELHAAGLLRAAGDQLCLRGGHAPFFNSYE